MPIDIDKQITELEAARVRVNESLRIIDERISFLESVKELTDTPLAIEVYQVGARHGENGATTDVFQHQSVPAQPDGLVETSSLIANCQTFVEACEILAEANGGLLLLNKAAHEFQRVGLSKSKKAGSISGTIHGHLKKRPDWRHEGPGMFRRIGSDAIVTEVSDITETCRLAACSTAPSVDDEPSAPQ